MTWWRYLTGFAVMELRGVAPERLLTALALRSIGFWDADKTDEYALRFAVPLHEAEFVEKLAESQGLECETLSRRGLPRLWRRVKKRRALLIVLALCAALLAVSRLFIWSIEVQPCEGVTESEIRAALSECGVDVGCRWTGLSQDLLRNALLRRVPELRWATVNVRGSCAEVILRPKREKPEPVNETETADITASQSGYVTELLPMRGTARAAAGDTVLKGETLIEGLATGRYETHGAVRAIGQVRARCWTEISACAPETLDMKQPTGRTKSRWALIFGKRRINLFKGCSICPAGCAKIAKEAAIAPAGVSLPIRLVREICTEYETAQQSAPELREALEAELSAVLTRQVGEDGEVTALRFTQSRANGMLYVTAHAECEQSIAETVPHIMQP